jgi:hypothetical protein
MEMKRGLYETINGKSWLINVKGTKFLYVGSETDARLEMNSIAEDLQRMRDEYRERQGKKPLKSEILGTMREIKSLNF